MKYNIKNDFEKLEKAGINPIGLHIEVSYSQNMHELFIGSDDTTKYVDVVLTMSNHLFNDTEEYIEEYGVAYGKMITTFDRISGRNLDYIDVIDSIDQDTYNCLSVFMNSNLEFDDDLNFQQIFYIERIIIAEKFRGNGLGSILVEYIKNEFADIFTAIVLQPSAFELCSESSAMFDSESERLCHFYGKHGFTKYRDNTWMYYEC